MRAWVPCTVAALVSLSAVFVAADAAASPTAQQFLRIRSAASPELLPDGSLLVRDWPDGVWQLHRVRPDASGSLISEGARRERLTDYADGLSRYSLSPDGRHVVLMHARGGDENTQLTLMPVGEPATRTPVLADADVQADVNVWMRDGSAFLYQANATRPTDFHVYLYDLATKSTRPVVAKEGAWRARDVSADAKRVLVTRRLSASESHVFELDLASGRMTEITVAPKGGVASCEAVGYLPGDRSVLLTSDHEGGVTRLYARELKSGKVRAALPALADRMVDGARMNDRRDLLAVNTNEDGYSVLRVYRVPDLEPVALPEIARGVVQTAAFRGSTLVYLVNSPQQPALAWAIEIPKSGAARAARPLTSVDTQGIDLAAFPMPEVVRYASFDGREIPALLYFPPGHVKGAPIPFVVNYHGGPEGQSRPTFNANNQYLLSRGFGVLQPNVRGSTGYGREFQMLDDYRKRWDSVKDGVAAAAWLVKSGHAVPGKIAAMGGSYGGFMSVACVVEDQEAVDRGERGERLFGACVDVVGIVNMQSFLERTSAYRRKLREVEYGPLSDPEFLKSISSLHRADKIQVPVFIAHGFNDPRVPVEEAMQLAAALRAQGRRPRMFIAPDEGHGFQKLDNRIYYGERMAAFLEETLKGVKAQPSRSVAGADD